MAQSNNYGLILAGGRGTRFWPRSRRSHAKQVLKFTGERSLIQETVDRLQPVLPPERIWILTNEHLQDEIVRQLPEVPQAQILAEPAQRNTAPAIGLAAQILQSLDPDSVLGVFPADHLISKPQRYLDFVRPAFETASEGKIVVLGIQPRWVETGYGYIEFPKDIQAGGLAPLLVSKFHEKPNTERAQTYFDAGNYYWNAGMFFWRTSVLLGALRDFLPKTASLLASLPAFKDEQFIPRMKEIFPLTENISIDYAVLEKVNGIAGFAVDDIGWSDVGSWNAVYELLPRDAEGNVSRSESLVIDSSSNYIDAQGKMVAMLGVSNLIVVDTPDALLIADRSRAQEVGEIVKRLEAARRDELL